MFVYFGQNTEIFQRNVKP